MIACGISTRMSTVTGTSGRENCLTVLIPPVHNCPDGCSGPVSEWLQASPRSRKTDAADPVQPGALLAFFEAALPIG